MKNNAPECVLLSPEEYVSLMDDVNDARLLMLANERLANTDMSQSLSEEEVYRNLGITEEDLEGFEEVEIEITPNFSRCTMDAINEAQKISGNPDIKGYTSMDELMAALTD